MGLWDINYPVSLPEINNLLNHKCWRSDIWSQYESEWKTWHLNWVQQPGSKCIFFTNWDLCWRENGKGRDCISFYLNECFLCYGMGWSQKKKPHTLKQIFRILQYEEWRMSHRTESLCFKQQHVILKITVHVTTWLISIDAVENARRKK